MKSIRNNLANLPPSIDRTAFALIQNLEDLLHDLDIQRDDLYATQKNTLQALKELIHSDRLRHRATATLLRNEERLMNLFSNIELTDNQEDR